MIIILYIYAQDHRLFEPPSKKLYIFQLLLFLDVKGFIHQCPPEFNIRPGEEIWVYSTVSSVSFLFFVFLAALTAVGKLPQKKKNSSKNNLGNSIYKNFFSNQGFSM
jgi:hypothetical protein